MKDKFIPLDSEWVHVKEVDIERMVARIAELEGKLDRVQKAIKNAFTCLTACDEMLMVHMDRYNDIVEAFKEQSE